MKAWLRVPLAALAVLLGAARADASKCDPKAHPRCLLDSYGRACYRRGGLNSIERKPCRFVCTSADPDIHEPIFVAPLREAICEDLP